MEFFSHEGPLLSQEVFSLLALHTHPLACLLVNSTAHLRFALVARKAHARRVVARVVAQLVCHRLLFVAENHRLSLFDGHIKADHQHAQAQAAIPCERAKT